MQIIKEDYPLLTRIQNVTLVTRTGLAPRSTLEVDGKIICAVYDNAPPLPKMSAP